MVEEWSTQFEVCSTQRVKLRFGCGFAALGKRREDLLNEIGKAEASRVGIGDRRECVRYGRGDGGSR